jgi:hypothetical protein
MRPIRFFSTSTAALCLTLAAVAPGCGDDESRGPLENNLTCSGTGGPVEDGVKDAHCTDDQGQDIAQVIGKCEQGSHEGSSGAGGAAGATGSGGAGGEHHEDEHGAGGHEEHEEEEEHAVHTSTFGADDDCKYDVRFTNSCVEVNKPVTFTLTLTERATSKPAVGAKPANPEVFLADEPSHISPSINIKAPEDPAGTYAIGPILFDRSGRWVVRFHYFETCSDVEEDSPHGHIAFYIDVP